MAELLKPLFFVISALLFLLGFVGVAFANPIPMEPAGSPVQYASIVLAEICGLLAGTTVLTHSGQTDWRRATLIMSICLVVSYTLGIIIWAFGYMTGILYYNSIDAFFAGSPHPLTLIVLLLPEFIGTIVGTVLIRANLKIGWKMALAAMAIAMLTSLLVGLLIMNVYLRI